MNIFANSLNESWVAFRDTLEQVVQSTSDFSGWLSNNFLWTDYTLFFVMGVGILFTIWSRFCQYRALTHGVAVIRGKYDDKSDPGAISHFQALSAALSGTVGLGNIGGVAGAIALGGPGAVFWMWMVGIIGMALKTTEVSLAMLYRNTDDPDNPHGGAMWVADKGFARFGHLWGRIGKAIAILFCLTLLVATVTGGNMFQAWNVAEVTQQSFQVPRLGTGIVLAILTGLVIIGGIKSIGTVAGYLVPFMCITYLLAGLYVLAVNAPQIPSMFAMIFQSAFSPTEAQGAFLGGTFGYAFLWGMKRSLFSNEAGQGSSPMAHSAAKTDEPIREGLVAGLEPFIDTILVCTMTAIIVLSSGAWNREAEGYFAAGTMEAAAKISTDDSSGTTKWKVEIDDLPLPERIAKGWHDGTWTADSYVFVLVRAHDDSKTGNNLHLIEGHVIEKDGHGPFVSWEPVTFDAEPEFVQEGDGYPIFVNYPSAALTSHAFDRVQPGLGRWLVPMAAWLFAVSTIISWSYYGEQGVVYLFGNYWVMAYRIIYCILVVVATMGFVSTDAELQNFTDIGTGLMLVVNLPICLIFGHQTMRAYHDYVNRLRAGEFKPND